MSFQSQIDDILTNHSGDAPEELERKLAVFDVNDIVAVVAKRAANAGGGSSPVSLASATLTNAQIKALPSSPFTLVADPGAGNIILGVAALLSLVRVADYTNIDANSFISFTPTGGLSTLNGLSESGQGAVTTLLAVGGNSGAVCGVGANTQGNPFDVTYAPSGYAALALGGAMRLTMDNGGSGDLTGGNSGNSLTVALLYAVVAV